MYTELQKLKGSEFEQPYTASHYKFVNTIVGKTHHHKYDQSPTYDTVNTRI